MASLEMPLVSVIIPTYNRAGMVKIALMSVFRQSYKNIEILVVDDGSTDNTLEEVQKLRQTHDNLILLHKENGGCASARNMGLENARGDMLTFLDSDDQWEPYTIEKMVETLQINTAELVYSPSIEVYKNGRQVINQPASANDPENLAVAHFMNTNVRNGSFMFSRSVLIKTGVLDESLRFNEDSDFFQRLAINSKAVYLSYPTVRVLNHPGGKSRDRVKINEALLKSYEKIIAQYPDFAERIGYLAETRKIQICNGLEESLILKSKWDEVISLQQSLDFPPGLINKISIKLKNNFPTQSAIFFRKVSGRIFHIFSTVSDPMIMKVKNDGR